MHKRRVELKAAMWPGRLKERHSPLPSFYLASFLQKRVAVQLPARSQKTSAFAGEWGFSFGFFSILHSVFIQLSSPRDNEHHQGDHGWLFLQLA